MNPDNIFLYTVLIVLCYIIGSIPFGLIITKIFGHGDIRSIGSGNIGATNVLRTGNKLLAVIVLVLDFIKCYLPIIAISFFIDIKIASLCGLFSITGHIFPIWLNFKGGKGVACLFGFILALNPLFFLILIITWLIIVIITKYSSLASIISAITIVFLFFIYDNKINDVIPLTITILILFKHKENIKRLIKNKENKINIL